MTLNINLATILIVIENPFLKIFFLNKSIRDKILIPCHKEGQGQHSVLVVQTWYTHLMLNSKFQNTQAFGSREDSSRFLPYIIHEPRHEKTNFLHM